MHKYVQRRLYLQLIIYGGLMTSTELRNYRRSRKHETESEAHLKPSTSVVIISLVSALDEILTLLLYFFVSVCLFFPTLLFPS